MRAPSRLDMSPLGRWWWSVDQTSLYILVALATMGVTVGFAAGPVASARLGIDNSFHFPLRQLLFLGPALATAVVVSMLTPLQARRVGTLVFAFAVLSIIVLLVAGPEINGAKRWAPLGSFGFQPSELLKPGFVVVAAWMLAEAARDPKFPGAAIAMGLYVVCAGLLVLQPDYGQAALLTMVWATMFFIAGCSMAWLVGILIAGSATMAGGYLWSPHIARRIDAFLDPSAGGNYQVDKAMEAISNAGLGMKMKEPAFVKFSLPDAHTDFVFAVAAEEFGVIFCLIVIGLTAAFVIRAFQRASVLKSVFAQTAACGLAGIVGFQALINIGVNLRMLPAKGMTLPFISYGGSSLIATGLTVGLLLALTRRNGHAARRLDVMP